MCVRCGLVLFCVCVWRVWDAWGCMSVRVRACAYVCVCVRACVCVCGVWRGVCVCVLLPRPECDVLLSCPSATGRDCSAISF